MPRSSQQPLPRPAAQRWESPWEPRLDAELAHQGWERVRLLHQMRRSLPLPETIRRATREIEASGYTAGDFDGLLAVNNRAFSWHPDQGGWSPEKLHERMTEDWFDPADLLVHHSPGSTEASPTGGVDGFCWTKVHDALDDEHPDGPRPAAGEIFVIAADPARHGTGLGRALTVAGLDHLAAKGLTLALLYVEADNAPAVSLYERLGMSVHHSEAGYARDGEP